MIDANRKLAQAYKCRNKTVNMWLTSGWIWYVMGKTVGVVGGLVKLAAANYRLACFGCKGISTIWSPNDALQTNQMLNFVS